MALREIDRSLLDAFFRRLAQYDGLTPEEQDALRAIVSRPERLPEGFSLVRQGERPGRSTLLLDGFTYRSRVLRDGGRQIVALHLPGDFVDLHSFLLKQMDHEVITSSPSIVARVAHEDLERLTERYPHVTRLLWLLTVVDAAIMREWAVSLGRRSGAQRLAHLICEFHLRLKAVGLADDLSFDLPITQSELGDMLGLSAVHTNRVLQELRKGLVSWEGQRVRILDLERLRYFADFDDLYLHLHREPR